MDVDRAWLIANAEVNARRKVARAKGLDASCAASLVIMEGKQDVSIVLASQIASSGIVEAEARRGRRATVLDNPA